MPYAVLEQKIKSLPQEYYIQVENFVQFMLYEASRKNSLSTGNSISEKLADVYSKIPENEQTASCNTTLESWRELTKNDSW
ncbi:MAG: hypothetical protein IJ727_04745 [Treponema sp.]|nr:hypothetical protein [Treponema sp.]